MYIVCTSVKSLMTCVEQSIILCFEVRLSAVVDTFVVHAVSLSVVKCTSLWFSLHLFFYSVVCLFILLYVSLLWRVSLCCVVSF